MKEEMSAFDVLAMTGEMQSLIGGYLDKVFHWDVKNVLLRINTQGQGKKELVLQGMRWLYLAPEKPDVPDMPSQFAVNLRKYLTNTRIVAVRQQEFDRIVELELEKGPNQYRLIIELFGDGNLVLVSGGKILNAIHSRKWRHREVRPGLEYSFPPSRFNPLQMDEASFRKAFLASTSDAVRTLATAINVGGQYAEDTCLRASVEKDRKAKSLSSEEIGRLYEALSLLLKEAASGLRPREIMEEGKPVDVTPVPLIQYAGREVREHATFSDAIHSYVVNRVPVAGEKEDPEVQRLQRQLDQQRTAVERQLAEAQDFAQQAEAIYSDYMGTDELLKKLKTATEGLNWERTTEVLSSVPGLSKPDPEEHRVTAVISGREVLLDYTLGVEGNANALYQQGKEAKEKMQGAQEALKETEKKLAQKVKEGESKKKEEKRAVRKTKEFWFERYKWFVTSEGRLVLAGRDAHSNDQLVKKHLKPTERFAHADVHGAPSVVVFDGGQATDEEMTEACTFALAHSKAWMAGASEGTAYWVLPDQVSKMAQAGEFVPRGAFVIRGKRNYLYHLPLVLAVGEIVYQGERKIMCGPLEAVQAHSSKYVVIEPGRKVRTKASAVLSRMFQVPEEEIARILPPGEVEIASTEGIEEEPERLDQN
ncbi:MAG: NFACT family protein [Methanomassiliicoccus sp.]|nr:NFACT family protein [Methanomassiliicoccus sp.]